MPSNQHKTYATPDFWDQPNWRVWLLLPLSLIYWLLHQFHRGLYSAGLKSARTVDAYVVVVGGVNVGGTGKSPIVADLVRSLVQHGLKVAVIARGYGVRLGAEAVVVNDNHRASDVGDEALMHYKTLAVPVAVHPNRWRAAAALEAQGEIDVIVADDGLQHYSLAVDYRICVLGNRRKSNPWLFPAGPWREPLSRASRYDLLLGFGGVGYGYRLGEAAAINGTESRPLSAFKQNKNLLAIAGIAQPENFFSALRDQGLDFESQAFADHYAYKTNDLDPTRCTLMTAKDAVKIAELPMQDAWSVALIVDYQKPWICDVVKAYEQRKRLGQD